MNTTAFKFRKEVISSLIHSKSDRVLTRAWNISFLFILAIEFGTECETGFIKSWLYWIRAWARVFISDGLHKRASNNHFVSSFTEAKTFFWVFLELIFEIIGIRRRGTWWLFGKIVFGSKAKSSCSAGTNGSGVIEFITSTYRWKLLDSCSLGEPWAFGESVEHFGFGVINRGVTYLVTVGYSNWHILFSSNLYSKLSYPI